MITDKQMAARHKKLRAALKAVVDKAVSDLYSPEVDITYGTKTWFGRDGMINTELNGVVIITIKPKEER